ncbi:N-acetylmuramoyl-L-alanine amidase [Aerococcaceae bacterium WGS1372]
MLTETEKIKLIEKYAPIIAKYESPISGEVRLAQLILESQLFTSDLAKKSNNGFGIKVSAPWTGEKELHNSMEVGGARDSYFRKYPTHEASIKDHAGFFTSTDYRANTAYKKAIDATNYKDEANALTGIYAGDPQYGRKLIEIIEKYDLTQYDNKKEETKKMAYIGLDIGHGKNSPARGGSRGWTGDEHGFNSKVAIRTRALLEAMGHKVTFGVQNPNSNEVGLAPRTNYFNAQKVDILISIHANAHSNTSVNGVSAFYDRYGRGRDSASLKLARAIMDEYRKQKQVIWSTGEVPSYRGNWTDFHMNRESVMPSVLMELGFMTGNRDREYVFGSKQAQFVEDMAHGIANGVDKYFGGAGQTGSTYNPQGLKETTPVKYTAPRLPFKTLKVGQTVTLLDDKNANDEYIWQWYDLKNKKLLKSGKQAELAGTTDEIVEIRDIDDVQHSSFAYKLKNYNSWILEEYLKEPRSDWEKVEEKPEDEGLQEGQFVLNGVKYQISEIK